MDRRITGAEEYGGQYIPEDTPPVLADAVVPGNSYASGIYAAGGHVPAPDPAHDPAADGNGGGDGNGGDTDNPGQVPPEVVPDQGDTDEPGVPDEVFPDDGDVVEPGQTPDETQPLEPSTMPPPD